MIALQKETLWSSPPRSLLQERCLGACRETKLRASKRHGDKWQISTSIQESVLMLRLLYSDQQTNHVHFWKTSSFWPGESSHFCQPHYSCPDVVYQCALQGNGAIADRFDMHSATHIAVLFKICDLENWVCSDAWGTILVLAIVHVWTPDYIGKTVEASHEALDKPFSHPSARWFSTAQCQDRATKIAWRAYTSSYG